MKRKYSKPYLLVESFQLNAAIAASCSSDGGIAIHYSEDTCTFDNGQYFNAQNCGMDVVGTGGDSNDTICYHGPWIANVTFINS